MDVFLVSCVIFTTTWLVFWTPTIPHSTTILATYWTLTIVHSSITPALHWTPTISNSINFPFNWNFATFTAMSTRKCCVPNCNKTRADECILHKFPNPDSDSDRFKAWVNSIGGDLLYLDNNIIFRQYRVCESHFDAMYISTSGRVTRNAVPTLLLSGIRILERRSLKDITNRTYARGSVNLQAHIDLPSTSKGTVSAACDPILPSVQSTPSSTQGQNKTKFMSSEMAMLRNKVRIIQKSKESVTAKLKKALKLSENPTFQKTLKKFTAAAMIFTMLQFREVGKEKMGRRFKKSEKVMALSLYKQGPRAYRWLRKFFVLPSPLTLGRMIKTASLRPGLNENIFMQLRKQVKKMSSNEKLCMLLFDEIALSPHFDYMRRNDEICGFVNNGQTIKSEIADHALVFMVRGIQKNYKQPLAYTFCAASTPKMELVQQIRNIVAKLNNIGLKVIATVCDQGSTNVSAINYLIEEYRQECFRNGKELRRRIFKVNGEEVVPLYDTPHLIKGIRNNLLNKNLKVVIDGKEKTAKWEHIMLLYNENPAYQGLRLMPKLTENHVNPRKISKMKVKCATQVFSRTVAANMGYLAGIGILPKECQETADVLIFFDSLFDSFNGSHENFKKRSGKPLLAPVTPHSAHKKQWSQSKQILSTMKFVDCNNKSASVPSVKNWIQTIENMEYIVDILSKKYHLTSLWMRHFNQDPLENFFGSIRSHGYRNNSPTCAGFEAAFASLLINNLSSVHSPGSNCEVDKCTMFKSLNTLFFKNRSVSSGTTEIDMEMIDGDHIFVNVNEKTKNPKIKAQLEYVTGYVLRKFNIQTSATCKQSLYNNNTESEFMIREFFKNKRCLTYPAHTLVKCFSNIQDVVTKTLQKDPMKTNIKQYMKTVFSIVIDYSFLNCNEHKADIIRKIEEISTNLFIFTWCKDANKVLTGARVDYDENCSIHKKCYEYCKRHMKK